jgi:hypothetical protein
MDGFEKTMAAIPDANTRRDYGTAYWDGLKWWVNIRGNLLDARWLDPIQPLQGGNIVVDITKDGLGQSSALVIGGYTDQPRPSTGTVLLVGVSEIVFTGDDGGSYRTDRFVNPYVAGTPDPMVDPPRLTYAPGDPVYLTWDAARPTIIGIIAAIAMPDQVAVPPAPPTQTSGQTPLVATASDTWGVGGWGRWATSQGGGEDVYSGTLGAYTLTGSWFYGAPKPELAGKSATRIRFKVPARLPAVGDYNSAVTIHLYAHTSQSRPGTDVTRVVGPVDVNVAAGSSGGFIDLPGSFFSTLAAGGGISIAGNPYVGFNSRLDDPESGKILIDWTA